MSGDWPRVVVKDLALRVTKGTTPPASAGWVPDGDVAFIKVESITDAGRIEKSKLSHIDQATNQQLRRSVLQSDDILFTIAGTIGRVAIVTPEVLPANTNQAVAIIRPNPEIVRPLYLYYALQDEAQVQHAKTRLVQSVQANLSLSELSALAVPLPSLSQQDEITSILSALDDKIELNRHMNQTLEQLAAVVFRSWFVDFDPVRARAAGRTPAGMDAETAGLFPDRLVESEIGEIPEGWRVCALSDICTTQYGFTASAAKDAVGPHFLRVTDINKQNWIQWDSVPYCVVTESERVKYRLNCGDIVVARMADPGKSAIIDEAVDAIFASYLVRLKSPTLAHSYYIFRYLKSDQYASYTEGAKGGSVQSNMNAKVIVGAKLVLPDESLLQKFLAIQLPLRQRMAANNREASTLAQLRDALLPRLLSGELRVPEEFISSEEIR